MGWKPLALGSVMLVATACSSPPPPLWAEGGAPLVIGPARWTVGDEAVIELTADGKVYEDGEFVYLVDRAGRVVDEDYEPVLILLPDGHVAGPNQQALGRVGMANAAPPGSATAWLSLLPNGQVLYFDPDGERSNGGVWQGCEGPELRTCTLITHVFALRNYVRRRRGGVFVGVGIGVGL